MKREFRILSMFAAGTACCGWTVAALAADLDQQNTRIDAKANANSSAYRWVQSITAGIPGDLVGVEIYVADKGSASFTVYDDGVTWSTVLESDTNSTWVYVDVTAAGITVTEGDVFTVTLEGIDGDLWFGNSNDPDAYADGKLDQYVNGSHYVLDEWDMNFKTYVERKPVASCFPIKSLKISCPLGAFLYVTVTLKGTAQSGKTVTVEVDGEEHVLTVSGKKATLILPGTGGSHVAKIVSPAGCPKTTKTNCA